MTAENVVRHSVVIPVYRNAESLPELIERLTALADDLPGLEVVFVVDGSPDDSAAVLRAALATSPLDAQLLCLSRNFGSFAAIRAGLAVARGDYIGVMAADLQEPPELMREFFAKLGTGEWDVAVGTREGRNDPAASRGASRVFWWWYRHLVQREMPAGGVDVFACTRQVAQSLVALDESNSSLVGLLYWVGFRRVEVPYTRLARRHGRSAWSFRKKLSYLLDSVFAFTSLPITAILTLGALGVAAALVIAVVVFVSWLVGGIQVPGYAATMLVLLFSTAAILFALGVVGTYVWRTFENTKGRPSAVVMVHESFGRDATD